jgi:hypothetical protein
MTWKPAADSVAAILATLDATWSGRRGPSGRWQLYRGQNLVWRFKTKKELQAHLDAIECAFRALAENPGLLTDSPHPKIPTMTARDYAEFLLAHVTSINGLHRALNMIADALSIPTPRSEGNVIRVDFRQSSSA